MLFSSSLNLGALLIASLAFTNPILAHPTELEGSELVARAVDPKDPFTWDTEYIKKNYIRFNPPKDTCYFYNGLTSEEGIKWAGAHHGTTVFDVYHCHTDGPKAKAAFNKDQFPFKNFVKEGKERQWFQITSRAYAQVCSGTARLLIPEGHKVAADSIWATDEYQAIVKGETKITNVLVVEPKKKLEGDFNPTPGATQSYPRTITERDELKVRDETDPLELKPRDDDDDEEEEESDVILGKRASVNYPKGGSGKTGRGTCPKISG